ncbi:MAG: GNAT family N-acetyltransferase [Nitrospiraceae bacterium]
MITQTDITYAWLDGDALDQLEPILESRGWTTLNKPSSRAIGAFDGDNLIGFIVLQMVPHTEPLYVNPDYRGSGVAESLAILMRTFMVEIGSRCFMVTADTPEAVKLCEAHGMKRIDSPVYLMTGE